MTWIGAAAALASIPISTTAIVISIRGNRAAEASALRAEAALARAEAARDRVALARRAAGPSEAQCAHPAWVEVSTPADRYQVSVCTACGHQSETAKAISLALAELASPALGYGYPQRWTTGLAATEGDQAPGG